MSLDTLFADVLEGDEISVDLHDRRTASSDVYATGLLVDAVLRPRDKQRLARAVGVATRAGYAIVARGGGMSYTGGYLPAVDRTLLIDTARLDRIVEINAEDMYITVEAGVTWKRIYEALDPLNLRLPFFGTFSGARATVGGGLSNGALFLGTARYGTAADCMLGLEVVLVDGTLVRTGQAAFRNVRKPFYRAYGPDLSGLFVHDSGALGVKVQATFRLIEKPAHSGFVSFAFPDMQTAGAALSAVARTGAAEEAYVFDPETTRSNLDSTSLQQGAKMLLNVVRGGSSLFDGLRQGAQLVAGGRQFVPEGALSLHVVGAGRSVAAVEADLNAVRRTCADHGGGEIANSIPKAVRASLFPDPDGVLGPKGDRWAALNAKVAHSDAARIMAAAEAVLAPHREAMQRAGVWMSYLLIAINTHAFSFEPVFHWFDEWLPLHEQLPRPERLASFERPQPNPEGRALVARLRAELVRMFAELGAASNQIGKTYPYRQSLDPATDRLLASLKAAVDPEGLLNPAALGFEPRARGS
jgi:FAD/FMN-containing dehydrogenase